MDKELQEALEGIKSKVDERTADMITKADVEGMTADFIKSGDFAEIVEKLDKLQGQFEALPLGSSEGNEVEVNKSMNVHELFTKSFKETGKHEAQLFLKAIRESRNVTGGDVEVANIVGSAFAPNPVRSLASVIETSATALILPVRSGTHGAAKITANRGTTAKTSGDAAAAEVQVIVDSFEALSEVSIESAEDIPGFDSFWTQDVVDELASLEAAEHAAVIDTLTTVDTAAAGTMTLEDLANLLWSVNPAYRANGNWMLSSEAMAQVRTMNTASTGGDLVFDAQLGAFRLFGYPVYENSYMAGVEEDACPAAFGDWKRGVVVASRKAATVGRYEQTKPGYYTYYGNLRSGAKAYVAGAVQALKVAA